MRNYLLQAAIAGTFLTANQLPAMAQDILGAAAQAGTQAGASLSSAGSNATANSNLSNAASSSVATPSEGVPSASLQSNANTQISGAVQQPSPSAATSINGQAGVSGVVNGQTNITGTANATKNATAGANIQSNVNASSNPLQSNAPMQTNGATRGQVQLNAQGQPSASVQGQMQSNSAAAQVNGAVSSGIAAQGQNNFYPNYSAGYAPYAQGSVVGDVAVPGNNGVVGAGYSVADGSFQGMTTQAVNGWSTSDTNWSSGYQYCQPKHRWFRIGRRR